MKKTFSNGPKFTKVFSLESFPLYSSSGLVCVCYYGADAGDSAERSRAIVLNFNLNVVWDPPLVVVGSAQSHYVGAWGQLSTNCMLCLLWAFS